MFVSFFPRPKLFFIVGRDLDRAGDGGLVRLRQNLFPETEQPVGLGTFVTPSALWFDFYFLPSAP